MNCPSAGIEQTFKCGKWFALDEGDKLIERTLYESSRKDREKSESFLKLIIFVLHFKIVGVNLFSLDL